MDPAFVKWLNGKASACFPPALFMDLICRFGHLVFVLYGMWLWWGGRETARRKRRAAAFMALFSVIVCSGISFLIGKAWPRPRPFARDPDIWNFTAHKANASFPSNHMMNSTAVSLVMLRTGMPGAVFLAVWAFLLAFSRLFAGIHYLTDLVGAVLLAVSVHMALYRSRVLRLTAYLLAEISLYIDYCFRRSVQEETKKWGARIFGRRQ